MKLLSGGVLVACALVSGCSLYKVARDGTDGKVEVLRGVPFLTREPVTYQMTQLIQTRLKVQYVMTVDGKEHRAPEKPLEVLEEDRAKVRIAAINNSLSIERFNSPDEFKKRVAELIRQGSSDWHECGSKGEVGSFCANPSPSNSRLASNRLTVRTEISGAQHYINVRRPLIGKATASVDIGADGTLTKSTTEFEGKTLETIASIVPFSEYALKVLKLGDYADQGKGNADGANKMNNVWLPGVLLPKKISITCEMVPEAWLYVLERRASKLGEPLQYTPTGGVGLVSANKVGAEAKTGGDAGGAWEFSGKITPPNQDK